MSVSIYISRFSEYYRRNGFFASLHRLGVASKRALFYNRMVVFYCDLGRQTIPAPMPRGSLKVERLQCYNALAPHDLQEMISIWNPKQTHRNIWERFEKGASLWIIRSDGKMAGYTWTLRGTTIAGYYFPMAPEDVQLFDFYVFPKFRGGAILWFLISHVLYMLQMEGVGRVFGDVAEWNLPSLSFYKMTPFRRLGLFRIFSICGHPIVTWVRSEPAIRQSGERRFGFRSYEG